MVTVSYGNNEYICKCSFEERTIPREAGFSFDGTRKLWYTPRAQAAARLLKFADESAKNKLNRILLSYQKWTAAVPFPTGLSPYPFQVEAARFALSRNRSYLGLDPGLGKTIVAALIINALPDAEFAYVCPPFLVANVKNELRKWGFPRRAGRGVTIIKDTTFPADPAVKSSRKRVLIVDEAHRFKNPEAKRTKALFGIAEQFDFVIFMSGTPMPNRPIELFGLLSWAAWENIDWMPKHKYALKFCAAHHNGFGWDYNGAKNMPELRDRVQVQWQNIEDECEARKLMLRIRKNVLDLPPKIEEVVLIADNLPAKIGALDRELVKRFGGDDLMKASIAADLGKSGGELHLATYRRELGRAKVPASLAFIESILEETDENLILATWHREVASELRAQLAAYDPILIDGTTDPRTRPSLADEYQRNPKRRVAILNIIAGGIGLNLQKANRVLFIEASWVPGDNQQLSDRAHRIGTRGTVLCQYLVFRDSIDRAVVESMLNKRRSTDTL